MFRQDKYPVFKDFLKKRFVSLLIPYLIYSGVMWLVWTGVQFLLHSPTPGELFYPLGQTFIAQGSAAYIKHDVPLWFITCLFVVEVMYFYLQKLPRAAVLVVSVVCAVIGSLMIREGSMLRHLPWNLDVAFCALIFYALGNIVANQYQHAEMIRWVTERKNRLLVTSIVIVCSLLLVAGAWYNGHVTLGSRNLGKSELCFYLTALVGITAVLMGCIIISQNKIVIFQPLLNALKTFGRYSFDAMAIHHPIQVYTKGFLGKVFPSMEFSTGIHIMIFITTLLSTCAIMYVVCKIRAYRNQPSTVTPVNP